MKITKIIIAVALATAILAGCGGDDVDITINKVNSDYEFDDTITVVPNGSQDVTVHESQTTSDTSSEKKEDTSSKVTENTSSTPEKQEIPSDILAVVEYSAEYFFPQEFELGFRFYSDGIETIGGYECHVVEVFSAENTFLATYAVATEYADIYFAYDNDSEKYRIMTIGNTKIMLGDFADTLVTHGVYTNQPAGYTFTYDGEPNIKTDFNITTFETPLWLVAIEGEVPTASLDFSNVQVRDAQENTVMREMLERLGFNFDWALESDTATVGGTTFIRRPFFAKYGTVDVEIGTVYYGYARNGMFYKIVAFNLGESNSVSDLLNNISFVDRVVGGTVGDDRTVSKIPTRPDSADENGDYNTSDSSETVSAYDRPFGW